MANQPLELEDSQEKETPRLKFQNCRKPTSVEELSLIERAQLEKAGKLYDGEELSAETRLCTPDQGDEETSFYGFISLWDLVNKSGNVLYTAWFYKVDSGSIFSVGTTDIVAEIIQCGIECDDDEFVQQLIDAVKLQYKEDSSRAEDITIFC